MNNDQLFSISGMLALCGWLLLLIAPQWRFTKTIIFNGIIIILSLLYAWLILLHFDDAPEGGFNSLSKVAILFQNPALLLAGWIHYLAFDLLTGLWLISNANRYAISRWLLLPCLFLTFMFGPMGLLTYILIRTIKTKDFFISNY